MFLTARKKGPSKPLSDQELLDDAKAALLAGDAKTPYTGASYTYRQAVYLDEKNNAGYHKQHIGSGLTITTKTNLGIVVQYCEALEERHSTLNDEPLYWLASAHFYLGENAKAAKRINQIKIPAGEARKRINTEDEQRRYARYFNRRGEILLRLNEDDKAIKDFETAAGIKVTNPPAWPIYNCAIYWSTRNLARSLQYFILLTKRTLHKTESITDLDTTVSISDVHQWNKEERLVRAQYKAALGADALQALDNTTFTIQDLLQHHSQRADHKLLEEQSHGKASSDGKESNSATSKKVAAKGGTAAAAPPAIAGHPSGFHASRPAPTHASGSGYVAPAPAPPAGQLPTKKF